MKYYHICLSGKDEIMFRTDEDYCRAINCMALAAYKTNSKILAYAFMSTHVHLCIRTDHPYKVITIYRYAYTRYFNTKYFRRGKLGEIHPFIIEIDGLYHILAAICYVLRNPLHHGVSETAFGYPYSSITAYFKKSLGTAKDIVYLNERNVYKYIPRHTCRPTNYRMNIEGVYINENFIAYKEVEHMFVTARSFCYYMNRLSSEEWLKEQDNDNNNIGQINLQRIESGIKYNSISEMLQNEHGRLNYKKLTDIELCAIIDNSLPKNSSIYTISYATKEKLQNSIIKKYKCDYLQVRRCLGYCAKYK